MLLAIDVGNTNMVFGMFEGETFTGSFRLMTDANRTSDEIGLSAWEYFQRFGLKTEDVENVIKRPSSWMRMWTPAFPLA